MSNLSNMTRTLAAVFLFTYLAFASCKTTNPATDGSGLSQDSVQGYGLNPQLSFPAKSGQPGTTVDDFDDAHDQVTWPFDIAGTELNPLIKSAQPPQPGRYLGYAHEPQTSLKIPIIIDLIFDHQQGSNFTYQALIKASQGGFNSYYYQTYYIPDWTFQPQAGTFTSDSQQHLRGLFGQSSANPRRLGAFSLQGILEFAETPFIFEATYQDAQALKDKMQHIFPNNVAFPVLAGHYIGQCADKDGKSTSLSQLHITSAIEHYTQFDFPGLKSNDEPIASFADSQSLLCPNKQLCINQIITGIDILPSQKIELTTTDQSNITCELKNASLACQSCNFTRNQPNKVLAVNNYRQFKRPSSLVKLETNKHAEFVAASRPLSKTPPQSEAVMLPIIEGQYAGYLHHEASDILQVASLVVSSKQAELPDQNSSSVNGAMTIYFGDASSREFIAYRLEGLPSKAKDVSPKITTTGDGFMMVDYMDNHQIRGAWYSSSFGRVGTMVLFKNHLVALPESLQSQQQRSLNGHYESNDWQMEILTSAGISDSKEHRYPVSIYGWTKSITGDQRRRHITSGFYDFYTGYLSLSLDDGSKLEGQVLQDKQDHILQLSYLPRPRYGNVFESPSTITVKKTRSDSKRQVLLTP